jgi:hypothetical protein
VSLTHSLTHSLSHSQVSPSPLHLHSPIVTLLRKPTQSLTITTTNQPTLTHTPTHSRTLSLPHSLTHTMLQADRKVLQANLARGTLTIQYRLITLYSHNLSALGTNAALIANLAILGVVETDFPKHHEEFEPYNSSVYYVCLICCIVCAFVAFTQSSMEVIWVPSKALSGTEVSVYACMYACM